MDSSAMFTLSYGLFVITAKEDDFDNGCIVNTVAQVTDTPNRVTVTISKQNKTHDMIMKTKKFTVSVLSEKVPFKIFQNFGFRSGNSVDKFANFENKKRSEHGLLYLPEFTCSYLDCTVIQTIDLETHTLFVADVINCEMLSTDPAVTYSYYHQNIKPTSRKPQVKGWRCKICGYIHEGDPLPDDFICPICKHGASDFEKIG